MANRFDKFFEILMKLEGGYSNDKDDAGGETKFGISKRSYPNLDIKNLTKEKAKEIYSKNYYDKSLEKLNERLALLVFLMSVNAGIVQSVKILQRAINDFSGAELKADGFFGPKTINAAMKIVDIENFILKYKELCKDFYLEIIDKKPSNKKYLGGWLKRLDF